MSHFSSLNKFERKRERARHSGFSKAAAPWNDVEFPFANAGRENIPLEAQFKVIKWILGIFKLSAIC